MRYLARVGEKEFQIEVAPRGGGRFSVSLDGKTREIERRGEGAVLWLSIDGRVREAAVVREGAIAGNGRNAPGAQGEWSVVLEGRPYSVTLQDPQRRRNAPGPAVQEGPVEVRAIMPGKITALLVKEGQEVRSGQGVLVVEAMKMENELLAPKEGRVSRIRVRPGETVEAGAGLFTVE
jgi:glutaconyl-CoA/methylmalonyl-CoA decarboxylase subunit gamma